MKITGWEGRLREYLHSQVGVPFKPGKADCALFTAGAVKVITGQDLARGWRGKYKTLEGGKAALEAAGLGDHIAIAAANFPEVAPAMAEAGDVAVVEQAGTQALGILQGEYVYIMGRGGFGMVPREQMVRAFRL